MFVLELIAEFADAFHTSPRASNRIELNWKLAIDELKAVNQSETCYDTRELRVLRYKLMKIDAMSVTRRRHFLVKLLILLAF